MFGSFFYKSLEALGTPELLFAAPEVEQLECRRMLSGSVQVNVSGSNVTIVGDQADNAFRFVVSDGQIRVVGLDDTVIIGGETGVDVADLNNLTIRTKGGNDWININQLEVGGRLRVISGDGGDFVALQQTSVARQALIRTGDGSDRVQVFTGVEFVGAARLQTGDGSDLVVLRSADVTFAGRLGVRSGEGDDRLEIGTILVGFEQPARVFLNGNREFDTLALYGGGTLEGKLRSIENVEVVT